MFEINQTPILILSAPRTGSTVLGAHIKSLCKKDIPYFQEPDYAGQEGIESFRKHFDQSKEFILKCHLTNLYMYGQDVSDYLLQKAYLIRIRRKDVVKQSLSFYIALARNNQWEFTDKSQLTLSDNIPINVIRMKYAIKLIKEANHLLDTIPVNFKLDLYYEDLPEFNSSEYYVTPRPLNYNELLDVMQTLI